MIGGETQNPAPEFALVHDVDGVNRQNLFEMQNEPIGLLAELRLREHVEGKAERLLEAPGQRIVRQRLKPGCCARNRKRAQKPLLAHTDLTVPADQVPDVGAA